MISRAGVRVPPGDGAEVDRRTVGTDAPATGSARVAIGMATLWLTLVCLGITFFTWTVNGVTLLGTIFFAVFIWAIGAHRRQFWES
ncbi:hypothetical protein AB0E56_13255 [Microbacterium sp. NPDC028030]|uniref:hypothetical protein n=1 Tax=Microbacterium sp. NPDC028030 TaxID=3155124 RepID=UPI0033FF74E2